MMAAARTTQAPIVHHGWRTTTRPIVANIDRFPLEPGVRAPLCGIYLTTRDQNNSATAIRFAREPYSQRIRIELCRRFAFSFPGRWPRRSASSVQRISSLGVKVRAADLVRVLVPAAAGEAGTFSHSTSHPRGPSPGHPDPAGVARAGVRGVVCNDDDRVGEPLPAGPGAGCCVIRSSRRAAAPRRPPTGTSGWGAHSGLRPPAHPTHHLARHRAVRRGPGRPREWRQYYGRPQGPRQILPRPLS